MQAQEADVCLTSCSAEGLAFQYPSRAAVQSGVSDDDPYPIDRFGPARFKLVDCTVDVVDGFVLGDDRPGDDFEAVFYTDHPTTETSGDDSWLVQPGTDVQPLQAGSAVPWPTTSSEDFLELRRVCPLHVTLLPTCRTAGHGAPRRPRYPSILPTARTDVSSVHIVVSRVPIAL